MSQTDNRYINSETDTDVVKIDIVTICIDFLRVFRKMWIYAVIFALIGGSVFGYRANSLYKPYYVASATFTINIYSEQAGGIISTTSFYDNEAAEQMARVFPHILTSGVLQRKVAKELGTVGVPGIITAQAEEGTNLFTLSVRDTDPVRANDTLKSVMKNYPEISESIIGKVNMNLLDETGIPVLPVNEKNLKRDVLKGVFVGGTLAAVWMIMVASLRKTVRREEDCPRYIHRKCLGSIPYIKQKRRSKNVRQRINILEGVPNWQFVEAIRIIRNKLERSAKENSLKVILITSALAGEGKSTIAVNLAISLAQEGKKVALMDCDFRNPSDDEILNLESEVGLIDVLNKSARLSTCVQKIELEGVRGQVKMLYLPVGKPVPDGSVLLGLEHIQQIISSLKDKMDYVILDSAPVGLLTDASVLAQHADGAIFIIKKDYAKTDYILNGMGQLLETNIHIIGCVLNGN